MSFKYRPCTLGTFPASDIDKLGHAPITRKLSHLSLSSTAKCCSARDIGDTVVSGNTASAVTVGRKHWSGESVTVPMLTWRYIYRVYPLEVSQVNKVCDRLSHSGRSGIGSTLRPALTESGACLFNAPNTPMYPVMSGEITSHNSAGIPTTKDTILATLPEHVPTEARRPTL